MCNAGKINCSLNVEISNLRTYQLIGYVNIETLSYCVIQANPQFTTINLRLRSQMLRIMGNVEFDEIAVVYVKFKKKTFFCRKTGRYK